MMCRNCQNLITENDSITGNGPCILFFLFISLIYLFRLYTEKYRISVNIQITAEAQMVLYAGLKTQESELVLETYI